MRSIIRLILLLAIVLVAAYFVMDAFIIEDIQREDCVLKKVMIDRITEGGSYDIVLEDTFGDKYYINRGIEHGLNIDSLQNRIGSQMVTLYLPKLPVGISEHIAQLSIRDRVLYTEFLD